MQRIANRDIRMAFFTNISRNNVASKVNIYDVFFVCDTEEELGSGLRNRVARWAAGYNVVRIRQSDRRFMFSHYPDSKKIAAKFLHFSVFHYYSRHMLVKIAYKFHFSRFLLLLVINVS